MCHMSKMKRAANAADDDHPSLRKAQDKAVKILDDLFPRISFAVDENTSLILDALRRPTHNSRVAIARTVIEAVMSSPDMFPVAEFYEGTWREIYFRPEQKKSGMQLTLPREFSIYLRKASKQVLGEENRSEFFRLLVALYAMKIGVLECVSTVVKEFRVKDLRGRQSR